MEAGPELDHLIAEKVMGYHVARFVWGGMEGDKEIPCVVWITDPSKKDLPPKERCEWTISPIPYSTDIAAAWDVAEEIDLFRKLGNEYSGAFLTRNLDGEWEILVLTGMAINDNETIATAPTAPLAICLAALKAVGHSPG